jgi:hypothetical protein
LALFQSIAREAEKRQISLTDEMFSGVRNTSMMDELIYIILHHVLQVVDFSEAERVGHGLAFVEFWQLRPEDTRSVDELKVASEKLLKGCNQHFRAGVTRIKKISGVVPPGSGEAFENRVKALLDATDLASFLSRAEVVIRDFPKTESWLRWWMRESHASMLFVSHRKMEAYVWDRMPDTTNAEEAMHWKLYAAVGRNQSLLDGLYGLYAVAEYYHRLYMGTLSMCSLSNFLRLVILLTFCFAEGVPIRYGQPEPWKVISQQIGRTKPSRAPNPEDKRRKKNDG